MSNHPTLERFAALEAQSANKLRLTFKDGSTANASSSREMANPDKA
jgi:hypothetical protein